MDTNSDYDPLEQGGQPIQKPTTNSVLAEDAERIKARLDAFRDLADRFYMLWWNLPKTTLRQVDRDIVDMFRMYMDLAPSLGVSRNGIPELKECCGRKRVWDGDELGQGNDVLVMAPAKDQDPALGWCPGDLIRRVSKLLGFKYCEKCDQRRRRINAFFRCGLGL